MLSVLAAHMFPLINIPVITQNFDKLIAEIFHNLPFNQFWLYRRTKVKA